MISFVNNVLESYHQKGAEKKVIKVESVCSPKLLSMVFQSIFAMNNNINIIPDSEMQWTQMQWTQKWLKQNKKNDFEKRKILLPIKSGTSCKFIITRRTICFRRAMSSGCPPLKFRATSDENKFDVLLLKANFYFILFYLSINS
ncbi:unnamed protein product [Rhizophagus irregularis]|nr:unnamed protein product [Rhizophagus irregularis]